MLKKDEVVIEFKITGQESLDKARTGMDKLSASEQEVINKAKQLGDETRKAGNEAQQAGRKAKQGFDEAGKAVQSAKQSVGGLNEMFSGLGQQIRAALTIATVVQFGRALIDASMQAAQFQRRFELVTGSVQGGAQQFAFVSRLAKQYALDLQTTMSAYSGFAASALTSNLSLQQTQSIFESVTKALASMKVSATDSQLAFLAIQQMVSKGVVSAEELRRQFGERVPGAMAIAARSMNMTEREFNKMLATGKIISTEFLPRFAKELENTFGSKAEDNVNTLVGAFGRFSTAITDFLIKYDKVTKASDLFRRVVNSLSDGINTYTQAIENSEDKTNRLAEEYKSNFLKSFNLTGATTEALQLRIELLTNAMEANKNAIENSTTVTKLQREEMTVAYFGQQLLIKALNDEIAARKKLAETPTKSPEELTKEYRAQIAELKRLEALQIRMQKLALGTDTDKFAIVQNETAIFRIKAKSAIEQFEVAKKYGKLGVEIANKDAESLVLDKKEALLEMRKNLIEFHLKEFEEFKKQYEDLLKQDKEFQKKLIEQQAELLQKKEKLNEDFVELDKKTDEKIAADRKKSLKEDEDENKAANERIAAENELYLQESLNFAQTVFNGFMNLRQQALAAELSATQRLFQEQLSMFEGNQELQAQARDKFQVKERELRMKQFRAEQQAAIANAIFTAAPQIVKYIATAPPLAALVASTLIAQIGFIAAQEMPAFAKGTEFVEGPGTGTSDSVVARLSRGERVVPAKQNEVLTRLNISNEDLPKMALNYVNMTNERGRGNGAARLEKRFESLERTIKGLPVAALTLDAKGFTKSIRSGNRTAQILNNHFAN